MDPAARVADGEGRPVARAAVGLASGLIASICRLLGEPILFDPWKRGKAPRGGPFPEWIEWDRKIAELRTQLDRMKLVR